MSLSDPSPLIPAATVILLRDGASGPEVLMLRRNKSLKAFGGVWVFPGGRVDAADAPGADEITRARATAVRETSEETGLDISGEDFAVLSKWIPPVQEKRRFATWFFVARAPDMDVVIDDGEIHDFRWIGVKEAVELTPNAEMRIMPPTYVSLHSLMSFPDVETAIDGVHALEPELFETRFTQAEGGFMTLWPGDCAYDSLDLSMSGQKRRLFAGAEHWDYQTG